MTEPVRPKRQNRIKSFPRKLKILEPISKIGLGFRARREAVRKRSPAIGGMSRYFEPIRNTAMGPQIFFEIDYRRVQGVEGPRVQVKS